jgi:hypothetical protein
MQRCTNHLQEKYMSGINSEFWVLKRIADEGTRDESIWKRGSRHKMRQVHAANQDGSGTKHPQDM